MSNVYLLYGEEKYDLEQKVEKIKKEFDLLEVGLNLFYITKDNIDELASCLQGVTFFGSAKLIIIKDTKLKFNTELLKNLDEDIKVIIIEDTVDKRTSDYKLLNKIAECHEYKYMDSKQMVQYIMQVLKKYGVGISLDNAEYMQNICGEDKGNIINELQKIVIYMDGQGDVSKEAIDRVCSKTLNAKIFDVLSKIVNRERENAILMLDELLKQKEPIVKIYVMLYKQVKQMYMIKYLKERKEKDIASVMGIHPFVLKNLSRSCDKYTLDELKNIIYSFDEYDKKTKIGEMDFEIGLKKIICSM
ncbi:MAG: DNA polymerase III subunit delta [Clostridia bacterium]|nr:DNA polymerase III subunit delta [Clostridia bacterium]